MSIKTVLVLGSKPSSQLPDIIVDEIFSANGAAERARIYREKYKVPAHTIRPFNVFGPGQRLDDKRIIPDLMTAIIKNKPIILFSNGKATRSFCYISDAILAILLILFGFYIKISNENML